MTVCHNRLIEATPVSLPLPERETKRDGLGVHAEEARAGNTREDENVSEENMRYAEGKKGGISFVTTAETGPCRSARPLIDVPPIFTRQDSFFF